MIIYPNDWKLSQSQYIPAFNHFLGWITPWKQLLNNGSDKPECLLIMWLIKERNLAQMTCPFPLNVVVALQYKWFSQGFIHSAIHSQPFSLHSFDRTFLISRVKTGEIGCYTPTKKVPIKRNIRGVELFMLVNGFFFNSCCTPSWCLLYFAMRSLIIATYCVIIIMLLFKRNDPC